MKELFTKYEDEFLEFEKIDNKLSSRRDLHAFILLDSLVPGHRDMVCSAHHDEIYLDVEPDELEAAATEEQVVELIRCGVRLDEDGLCMFV